MRTTTLCLPFLLLCACTGDDEKESTAATNERTGTNTNAAGEGGDATGGSTDNANQNVNANGNTATNSNSNSNTNTNTNTNTHDDDDADPSPAVGVITLSPLNTLLSPGTVPFGAAATITVEAVTGTVDATLDAVEVAAAALSLSARPMHDDGVAPDASAGDGVYTAGITLSGSEVPALYAVEVVARGTDIEGNAVSASRTLSLIVANGYLITASSAGGLSSIAADANAMSYAPGIQTIALPFDLEFYGRTLAEGTSAALSDDGHLTFNGRTGYVNAGSATNALSVSDGAPGIAVHNSSLFASTMFSRVDGDAPNRTWILEWSGTYLPSGSGAMQLRFVEGVAGFTIHYGAMAPAVSVPWAMVAVDSDVAFNEVYTSENRPALETVSQTEWVFSAP